MGLCHAPVCGRHRTRGIVRTFSSDSCLACPDMPSIVEGNLSAHGLNNGSSFHSWGELQCSEPEPLVSSMPTLDTCYQQRVKGGLVFSNMPWLCYATPNPTNPPPPPPPPHVKCCHWITSRFPNLHVFSTSTCQLLVTNATFPLNTR